MLHWDGWMADWVLVVPGSGVLEVPWLSCSGE